MIELKVKRRANRGSFYYDPMDEIGSLIIDMMGRRKTFSQANIEKMESLNVKVIQEIQTNKE